MEPSEVVGKQAQSTPLSIITKCTGSWETLALSRLIMCILRFALLNIEVLFRLSWGTIAHSVKSNHKVNTIGIIFSNHASLMFFMVKKFFTIK